MSNASHAWHTKGSHQRIDRRHVNAACRIDAHIVTFAEIALGVAHWQVAVDVDDAQLQVELALFHGSQLMKLGHQRTITYHAYHAASLLDCRRTIGRWQGKTMRQRAGCQESLTMGQAESLPHDVESRSGIHG